MTTPLDLEGSAGPLELEGSAGPLELEAYDRIPADPELGGPVVATVAANGEDFRDFVWFTVRRRSTGAPVSEGYWSGDVPVSAPVADPRLGTVWRPFLPAPGLISIGEIPRVADVSARTVEIRLAKASARVRGLVGTYDPQQGEVMVFRGIFDRRTGQMLEAAELRYRGFIDRLSIPTATPGGAADVVVQCVTDARQMTRYSTATRSLVDQKQRSATDTFHADVATVGTWEFFWGGLAKGKVTSRPAVPKPQAPRDDGGAG